MRASTILLLLICSQALLFGQQGSLLNREVNVRFSNTSIEEILKSLESEDLSFVYSPEVFDVKKRVSINRQRTALSTVLNELFAGQQMEMWEMKGQILLRKKVIPAPKTETTIEPAKKEDQVSNTSLQLTKPKTEKATRLDSATTSQPKEIELAPQIDAPKQILQDSSDSFGSAFLANKGKMLAERSIFIPTWPGKEYSPLEVRTRLPYLDYSAIRPKYAKEESNTESVWDEQAAANKKAMAKKQRQERVKPEKKFRAGLASYTGYTEVDGTPSILLGGRVMYYPSPSLGVGVGGNAILSRGFFNQELNKDIRIEGGYGGLTFEYTLFPQSLVHLNIPITIGAGGFTYVDAQNPIGAVNPAGSQAFFAMEGGAELEINVAKFMKVGLGASYRSVSGTSFLNQNNEQEIINASILNGMNYGIVLKFGRF